MSGLIKLKNGIKQGDLFASTNLTSSFSVELIDTFEDCNQGINVTYRTIGMVLNTRHFTAKTKVLMPPLRDLLYAEDFLLDLYTAHDILCFMYRFS